MYVHVYAIRNAANLSRNIVSLQVLGRCFAFFTFRNQFIAQRKHLCRLKKLVAESRARVYFEQQILALLLVFSLSNLQLVLDPHQANQPISAVHFFNPQQTSLLRNKVITRGEKRETSTQNLQRNNVVRQVESLCILY